MDGNKPSAHLHTPKNDRAALRRIAAAIAISMLLHIGIALYMRPAYRPVNDFAVDFEIASLTPAPPKPTVPGPVPEPEPKTQKVPEKPAPKRSSPPKIVADNAPNKVVEEVSTDEPSAARESDTDKGAGSGICMHDLFAYTASSPSWLLYVSAAAFRESVYEKELNNTFNSFELGRRLAAMTGMDLTRDVESLLVAAGNIFDWRTFQIAASYDFGEETLMARIKERQKKVASFAWNKTEDGFEAAIPGQFRWNLVSSGRVMSIVHEPEKKIIKIPENPFLESADTAASIKDKDTEEKAAGDAPLGATFGESAKEGTFAWPKQISCIASAFGSAKKKDNETRIRTLVETARQLMSPNAEGHWPVAVLTTTDPRAVGLGARLGRRMGFETAAVRGYFTDPVRIEGYLRFSKDPAKVEALAADWKQDAERFAADPFLTVAGVSSLLKNLQLSTDGSTLRFSLEMKQGQVLSTLLFLQLQGKALERQLLSN